MQHDYERLHVALQMWREGESYIRDGSKGTRANADYDRVPRLWRHARDSSTPDYLCDERTGGNFQGRLAITRVSE